MTVACEPLEVSRKQEHCKGCGLNCISKYKRSKAAFSILVLPFNYTCFTGQQFTIKQSERKIAHYFHSYNINAIVLYFGNRQLIYERFASFGPSDKSFLLLRSSTGKLIYFS